MRGRHAQPRPRRIRITRWSLPLLAAVFLVSCVASAGAGGGFLRKAETDNPIAVRGCVIRFDTLSSTGRTVVPRIHANSTHACVGVTSLAVDWSRGGSRGDLIVRNSGGEGTIVSTFVEEDESFVQRGITCGPSGGGTVTRIRCYDRNGHKVPAYSKRLYGKYMNLWVGWNMWTGDL